MRKRPRLTIASVAVGFLVQIILITAIAVGMLPIAAVANSPVTGAAFTTVNEPVDGTGHCKNGNPNNNCNIYDGKQYVWLNGGPSTAYVGDGDYFFAVLAPGGQGDPNDGTAKNLSDDFDLHTHRTFTVTTIAGVSTVSYSGTHDFSNNKIRLFPYADTPNPGGVYILAICSLTDGYPVKPNDCKYDAFKIQEAEVVLGKPLTITKDAIGAYTNTFAWTITKDVDKTTVTQAGGSATFNYTVKVSHDAGAISGIQVSGTITVFNPNVDSNNDPVEVSGVGVTDTLSDGTSCAVTGGSDATLTAVETSFAYTCDLTSLPQGKLDNKATVSWPEQFLDNGSLLAAGSADFTFKDVTFTETKVDECVNVTDSFKGVLGAVCVGDANPTNFTYARTVSVPRSGCVSYDNTATFTTNDTGTTGSASKTITVCGDEPPVCPIGKIRQGIDASGYKYAEIDLQDTGGVVLITQSSLAKNVSLSYKVAGNPGLTQFTATSPPSVTFSPAVTSVITVRGTKINNALGSRLEVIVKDAAGNIIGCDPIDTTVIRTDGKPVTETHTDLSHAMSKITLINDSPGLASLEVTVNGTKFTLKNLKSGERRTLDVAPAMKPGNTNTISLKATGTPGGSATVVIADGW
jgi:hypothetical protein